MIPDVQQGEPGRAHEMSLDERFFDLVAAGRKTIEVRVNAAKRRQITAGALIRFRCRDREVLTRVTSIDHYSSFDDMIDNASLAAINPHTTRREQLLDIRRIYPPEREALGVLAIGVELLTSPEERAQDDLSGGPT